VYKKKTRDHQTGGLSSLQSHTIFSKVPLTKYLARVPKKKSIIFIYFTIFCYISKKYPKNAPSLFKNSK